MSSSPSARLRQRRLAGLSLRSRLIAAILALVAGVYGLIGVLTTLTLRDYLVHQLDEQVVAAGLRAVRAGAPPPPPPPHFDFIPDRLLGPGQPIGTIGARVQGGQVTDAVMLDAGGVRQQLNLESLAALAALPANGHPHGVNLPGLGED